MLSLVQDNLASNSNYKYNYRYCYYVRSTGDLQWERATGATESRATGPAVDHTYGTSEGYYVHVDASDAGEGEIARLISSPQIPGTFCESWLLKRICFVLFFFNQFLMVY